MRTRALAAAAALGVLLTSCNAAGDSRAESRAPVPPGLESACPAPDTQVRFPEGDLIEGATRVRLCPGPPLIDPDGDPVGGAVQGPADLLTEGVAALVSLVNRQPRVDRDALCNHDGGPELVYWFGYPDGDWRAVQFGSYGCNFLTVGEDLRSEGGAELATAFSEALTTQREGGPAPSTGGAVACPARPGVNPHSALVLPDVELSSATWCVSPRAPRVREAVVSPDLVLRLNAELWPGQSTRSHPCGEAAFSWIEGLTPWGDAVGYGIDSCGEIHPLHGAWVLNDRERHYVTPELEAAIRALPLGPVVDATSARVAQCPTWEAEPTYADGDLPEGATSLRICSGEDPEGDAFQAVAVPSEALTTGVDNLASLANTLPDWEPPDERSFCTQEHKPAINYVFGYPDGRTRSITYGYGECGLLEVGPPGDFPDASTRAKADPVPFFDAVNHALLAQRRAADPPTQRAPALTCEPGAWPLTMLPVTKLDLRSAALCVPEDPDPIALAPRLLHRLSRVSATATPGEGAPTCQDSRTARVVGTSTWGDPMEFYVGPCHSLSLGFAPGIQTFGFELPADLADDLFELASSRS